MNVQRIALICLALAPACRAVVVPDTPSECVCANSSVACFSAADFVRATSEREPESDVLKITVRADGKDFIYTDERIEPSDFTVAEEVERRRINDSLERKIELIDERLQKGADYKSALEYCFPRLIYKANEIADYLYIPYTDAEIVYNNGKFDVTRESAGRKLDEDRLYGGIYYSLKFFGGEYAVKAATTVLNPTVTQAELKANLVLRGSYTTDFSTSTKSRAHNVITAVKRFDGLKLSPGQRLSFNGTVGERTEDNGFKTAKIIVDGKYVDGVGGGVCQASTAIYNAALVSGLEASANSHSICPSYCPPGLDAMISSVSDLVVVNTSESDVYISVATGGGKATVSVYGAPAEYTVVPESVVVKSVPCEKKEEVDYERKFFDESAQPGERLIVSPGRDGIQSATYLKYYKSGKFIKRIKVRTNTYISAPQITAVAP